MKRLALPLALGLVSLLGTNLPSQDRVRIDGGPTPAPQNETPRNQVDDVPAPANRAVTGPNQGPIAPVAVWTSHDPAGPAPAPVTAPHPGRGDGPPAAPAKKTDAPMPPVDASTLKKTTVTAHLREAMAKDKNILWCDTFQLAWDVLGEAVGGPIALNNEPPMATALNEHLATKADLDDASCLAMAGVVRNGIIEKIQKALDTQFPDHDDFFENAMKGDHQPSDLVAFSYLSKNLAFNTPFFTMTKNPLTIAGTKVKSFGVWSQAGMQGWLERADQVEILDETSKSEFIVELKTKSANDRLILARVPAGATLKDTVDTAMKRIAAGQPNPFHGNDEFLAPVIDFHILRSYKELLGKTFVAANDGNFRAIDAALQDTRFRLNESGALLISQALIQPGGTGRPVKPRVFCFDQPFLVLMLRKDAKTPYFALWIDNAELLTPVEASMNGPKKAPAAEQPDETGTGPLNGPAGLLPDGGPSPSGDGARPAAGPIQPGMQVRPLPAQIDPVAP